MEKRHSRDDRKNRQYHKGTAIATFNAEDKYKGHAAIYLSHDASGITVYDQWVDSATQTNRVVQQRLIRSSKLNRGGSLVNTAENYFVIE